MLNGICYIIKDIIVHQRIQYILNPSNKVIRRALEIDWRVVNEIDQKLFTKELQIEIAKTNTQALKHIVNICEEAIQTAILKNPSFLRTIVADLPAIHTKTKEEFSKYYTKNIDWAHEVEFISKVDHNYFENSNYFNNPRKEYLKALLRNDKFPLEDNPNSIKFIINEDT